MRASLCKCVEAELRTSLEARDDLLAIISHELKSPAYGPLFTIAGNGTDREG